MVGAGRRPLDAQCVRLLPLLARLRPAGAASQSPVLRVQLTGMFPVYLRRVTFADVGRSSQVDRSLTLTDVGLAVSISSQQRDV